MADSEGIAAYDGCSVSKAFWNPIAYDTRI